MDNVRTFDYGVKRTPPTFGQALNWQPMMKAPTAAFLAKVNDKKSKAKQITRALDCIHMAELWTGLMGTIDYDDADTVMPQCVDLTMPVNHVTIVRRAAGVTGAFAYCALATELLQVKDLEDDFEVQKAMKRGWDAFEQRRREANEIEEGYGCDDSMSWMILRDIGKQPNVKAKMLAIADLAGRMMRSFGYQRREMPNKDPEEVVGATVGGGIERTLSTELAMLGDVDTADAAAMKILTNRQYTKDMEGAEEKTRGPLVLCRDESGSMHDGGLGGGYMAPGTKKWAGRNTWAAACCVALTRIAWAEDRQARCVHFGYGTEVQELPKDDVRALFEMSLMFLGGGTSIGTALKRGREVVGELEADGFDGADVVLITDGCDWDEDFHNQQIDHMDRDKIKLWLVGIGDDIPNTHTIRARAEKYTFAHDRDLSNKSKATDLAAGLDKAAMGNDPGAGGMLN